MIKEAIGFGLTVDEARENAVLNLNVSEMEDIQFDIITLPKKKTFGLFGGSRAEVRAYVEIPEKKQKQKKTEKKIEKVENKKSVTSEKVSVKKDEKKENTETNEKIESNYSEPVNADEIPADSNLGKAVALIKNVIKSLNCENITIRVATKENGALILLDGEDISIIIGRRGETLDALQYLASLVANNGGGHYKISINIGDYRERREETLVNLAKRISSQVVKTGKSRALEPMNPYERRIIHTTVQNIEGVVSNSFGEGSGRRIVISKEGVPVRPPRSNDRRKNNSSRSGVSKKAVAPISQDREPKRDADIPLYGKIN